LGPAGDAAQLVAISVTAYRVTCWLGRQILWPLDLVTFRNYRMLIRESTHNISPFSVDHGMVGRELPVLETAGSDTGGREKSDSNRLSTGLAQYSISESIGDSMAVSPSPASFP
jgi:hypothetical protein